MAASEGKTYRRMPAVCVPTGRPPGDLSAALLARRSATAFDATKPVALEDLGTVLRWCAGDTPRGDARGRTRRTYPSAGGLFPLEVYVAARCVVGLSSGLYHWTPPDTSLRPLPTPAARCSDLYEGLLYPWHQGSAALIIVTVRGARAAAHYGDRAERLALLEAGTLLQNLGLVAASLGLAGGIIGSPLDRLFSDTLLLDTEDELPAAAFALGHPPSAAASRGDRRRGDARAEQSRRAADGHACEPSLRLTLERTDLELLERLEPHAGLRALAIDHAARFVGLPLVVAVPDGLARVAPTLWPPLRRLQRIADAGWPVEWREHRSQADEPRLFAYWARVGEGRGSGADFFDRAPALHRAIGEAVERWAWHQVPPSIRQDGVGTDAMEVSSIAGYALDGHHGEDGGAFLWRRAEVLGEAREAWIPAQLVCGAAAVASEPELRPRVTTGIAAHPDRAAAILSGLTEVIERDAFMLAWLARTSGGLFEVDAETHPRLATVLGRCHAARVDVRLVRLPTDAPLSVVLAVAMDAYGTGPRVTLGAAAAFDAEEAALRACSEAVALWQATRRRQEAGHRAPAQPEQLDRLGRVLWWAERGTAELEFLWHGAGRRPFVHEQPRSTQDGVDALVAWCRGIGDHVYVADLLDATQVAQLGMHVVGVVVPGLHPMHLDERRPAFTGDRLTRRLAVTGAALNRVPHPFP